MATLEFFGEVISLGDGFWTRDRRKSGLHVDTLRGQNIPGNSRAIDRTLVPDGVVSHKSTDLRCKSYQSPQVIYRMGMAFVRSVANYRGEVRRNHSIKATYFLEWAVQREAVPRILEWFVPNEGVKAEQQLALRRVVEDGARMGVEVRLYRVAA
jgi:hypothetical protein